MVDQHQDVMDRPSSSGSLPGGQRAADPEQAEAHYREGPRRVVARSQDEDPQPAEQPCEPREDRRPEADREIGQCSTARVTPVMTLAVGEAQRHRPVEKGARDRLARFAHQSTLFRATAR